MKSKKVQSGIYRALALVALMLTNCHDGKAGDKAKDIAKAAVTVAREIMPHHTKEAIDIEVASAFKDLAGAVRSKILERDHLTRSIVDRVSGAFGGKYNVVVLNASNGRRHILHGLVKGKNGQNYYDEFSSGFAIYHVYVFKSGTFINEGDGGYINWAFTSKHCYDRKDKELHFKAPH